MSRPSKAHALLQTAKDFFKRLIHPSWAAGNTLQPGLELVIPLTIVDGATGDVDFVADDAMEVIGFQCIKRNGAGAGNTMQLKKGATAISDAVACATDDALTSAASIVDTGGVNVFAKGDTLRITRTRAAGTADALCLVRVVMR
jgi:hypothetical protein